MGKAELLGSCFAGNAGRKPAQSEPQRGRSSQATEEQSLMGSLHSQFSSGSQCLEALDAMDHCF